jgi:hypothetical protein
MAIAFDPANRRIILDTLTVTASEIWSRWVDWVNTSDNGKYLPALTQVGGDDLGTGLSIPIYIFLQNGWRVRPMEANHALTITGNLFVAGGGVPVVNTIGAYNVSVQYTVPVQAQAVSTGGGGASAADIWAYPTRTLTDYSGVWADAAAVDLVSKVNIAQAILRNRVVTDPLTGIMTVYADDNVTPLLTARMFETIGTSQPYRGQGAEHRERLA